jgi:hypothetical protein
MADFKYLGIITNKSESYSRRNREQIHAGEFLAALKLKEGLASCLPATCERKDERLQGSVFEEQASEGNIRT